MTPCVAWTGSHRTSDGRPIIDRQYVYRVLWEEANGPLDGLSLHHTCENKWCVNLDHLQPMSQGDHLREHGLAGDWGQADKTHCPAGHEYTEENTYRWNNERLCRACRRETKRRYNERYR